MESALFDFDTQRIGNFLEIIQYSVVCYVFAIAVARIINKYIFSRNKQDIKKMSFIELNLNILIILVFLVIVFYYIQKVIILVPSISSSLIPGFVSSNTLEYTIHIAFLYLFLEIFPSLRYRIDLLRDKFLDF